MGLSPPEARCAVVTFDVPAGGLYVNRAMIEAENVMSGKLELGALRAWIHVYQTSGQVKDED